jgi:amidohydrolase
MDAIQLRQALHQIAEIGFDVHATRAVLEGWFAANGIATRQVGQAGLLAHRPGPGRRILVRAELDALPLTEATGRAYASKTAHHACGHDGHMAMVAVALAAAGGTADVTALFQPAEETGEGMQDCLAARLDSAGSPKQGDAKLEGFEACFAIHNIPGAPLGTIMVRDGVAAMASTGLSIAFHGSTSHAAQPELARNAAFPIAATVVGCRQVAAAIPGAVMAIVGIDVGGPRYGTTAGSGTLMFTVRAPSDDGLNAVVTGLQQLAAQHAQHAGLEVAVTSVEPFPATMNHVDAVEAVRTAAQTAKLHVQEHDSFPWSEDFGYATQRWPGALIGLGSGPHQPDLHKPTYDFPDELLKHGIRFWTALMEAA